MKKTLYFVVEKLDGVGTTNGLKEITVYDMVENKPVVFARIESDNDESSRDAIHNYLEDNGYGDDEFDLIQL